ncbi:MAG: ATP-binding cassette domain-containing protein, partial [Acidobacteria bacterium]|nr:ATP-binding cassette domain-containing protein [Acidobacteriota bacterium]
MYSLGSMIAPAPEPASDDAVMARGLRKTYEDVVAVDHIDLAVRRGECFALLGPNGAGKTTTIEMLEGLTIPDEGEIEVLGSNWNRDANSIRQRIGLSLQETRLSEKLTVTETLRMFRSFYSNGRDPMQLLRELSLDQLPADHAMTPPELRPLPVHPALELVAGRQVDALQERAMVQIGGDLQVAPL